MVLEFIFPDQAEGVRCGGIIQAIETTVRCSTCSIRGLLLTLNIELRAFPPAGVNKVAPNERDHRVSTKSFGRDFSAILSGGLQLARRNLSVWVLRLEAISSSHERAFSFGRKKLPLLSHGSRYQRALYPSEFSIYPSYPSSSHWLGAPLSSSAVRGMLCFPWLMPDENTKEPTTTARIFFLFCLN
ncbi:hypothetical protein BDN71DRAFT_817654 [Pleurotus eryngii]|uniref:Uncharacterized protein n=1 Tax=Pleurotus eryngii TaxID=5323 RepID=A0A9P6D919_PLEER|nr:hypothetical protein BDN71DRAFT_817654 [Pleurotus eryngii]